MSRARESFVDDRGVHLGRSAEALADTPLDVLLAGHRIWSFHPQRDAEPTRHGPLVPWPAPLAERLDGVGEVSVVPHGAGTPVFQGTVRFGTSSAPLALLDSHGNPLSLDKGNRLQRSFEDMDDRARRELVEAARRVLDDLSGPCGLDAYLVYGCLLGAVRDGAMIGHDSDADLAWLSRHTHPFDIVRESRAAERVLRERGWTVVRMSAANFKVWVVLPNGKKAGVDVFGSFHVGGAFHLTGSLRGDLPREAIVPFGTVGLEGVEFTAPRDPEAFLAFTYGPGWREPDPAFHFQHPPAHVRMMDQWWRGTRDRLAHWQGFHASAAGREVAMTPTSFAGWALDRLPSGARLVDLGAGNGRDAFTFAEHGLRVTATDYAGSALRRMRATNRARDLPLLVRPISLESPYNALVRAAVLAHEPEPVHVYARFLLESLPPRARPALWRFCSVATRGGGSALIEVRTSTNPPALDGPHQRSYVDPRSLVEEVERSGGRVLEQQTGRLAPDADDPDDPEVCRLRISWDREQEDRT